MLVPVEVSFGAVIGTKMGLLLQLFCVFSYVISFPFFVKEGKK
jgi:hypothetical protein